MKPAFLKSIAAWAFIALLGTIVLLGLLHLKNQHSPRSQLAFSKEITTHLANVTSQANTYLIELRQRLARIGSDIDHATTTLSQTRANLAHASQVVQDLDLPPNAAQRPMIDAVLGTYKRIIDNPLQRYLAHVQAFRDATSEQKDIKIVLITVALLLALAVALYIAFKGAIHVFLVSPLQRAAQAQDNISDDSPALTLEEYSENKAGHGYRALSDRQPAVAPGNQAYQVSEPVNAPARSAPDRQSKVLESEF